MTAQMVIAVALGAVAIFEDLRSRNIPNWIPIAALVAGLAWNVAAHGWHGAVSSLLGAVAGFLVFLIFYLLGGMGGGDIKLMGGFGAVIGIQHVLAAAFAAALCGALIAVAVIGGRALRKWRRGSSSTEARPAEPESESIPYAPAIAAGVWLSLIA